VVVSEKLGIGHAVTWESPAEMAQWRHSASVPNQISCSN